MFYLSNGLDKKWGVAICISRQFPFTPNVVIGDKKGRYISVAGKFTEHAVTLIFYYALNMGQVNFFCNMLEVLMPHVLGHIVLGGDSNTSLDQILDKSNSQKVFLKQTPRQCCMLACLLHSYYVIDI